MINIAIFASGSGSNAENIGSYFKNSQEINCKIILSNKKDAYVHIRAKNIGIPSIIFKYSELYNGSKILDILEDEKIDYLILAGFLLRIPENILEKYPNKILNIHPSLLPKYGGKGMFGENVHRAVLEANEEESGITIHLVNKEYDEGEILFQESCSIEKDENIESLQKKVQSLEIVYPRIIEQYVLGNN